MPRSLWNTLGTTFLAAILLATPLLSADELDDQAADLSNESWEQRERVTTELLAHPDIPMQRFQQLIEQADTLEAQRRLLNIARHHFIRQRVLKHCPQQGDVAVGFINILADPVELDGSRRYALFVANPLPGMPAYEQLRIGDRVLRVDGVWLSEVETQQSFSEVANRKEVGDTLELLIWRDGQPLELRIGTTSIAALQQSYIQPSYVLSPLHSLHWQATADTLLPEDSPLRESHTFTVEPIRE